MKTGYIKITEYCDNTKIEKSFIIDLIREGIIKIEQTDDSEYLAEDDLPNLEMFSRWHYDLGVNLEGIDAMRHMLNRMKEMQQELKTLRRQIEFF